jgi:hypothetical protein|tara:strand:+ start:16877 stop:17068 length:192 start_codon:yes stop_codon:yes gene_type:complete
METITMDKEALSDLIRVKEEFDTIVESIELSNDPEVMASLERSEEQIKNRDFADWNELQNSSN